jgi:hypothetical protein
MPKYEIELALYRTVEANNIDEAADIGDAEKARLIDSGLAGDLGWREAVTTVRGPKKEN